MRVSGPLSMVEDEAADKGEEEELRTRGWIDQENGARVKERSRSKKRERGGRESEAEVEARSDRARSKAGAIERGAKRAPSSEAKVEVGLQEGQGNKSVHSCNFANLQFLILAFYRDGDEL
ncbi:hypothetical protein NL676_032710 [Syzygium grande]|nr:hypothetical protein NL676_032710 [Syzygium grande]